MTGLALLEQLARRARSASRRLRREIPVHRDYLDLLRRHGPMLRVGAERADPRRRALIVSLTDFVAQVKQEAMLGKALQLHGLTPVVLTRRAYTQAHRYFRAFGIDRFLYFDELVPAALPGDDEAALQALRARSLTAEELLGLETRGVRIGRHALSTVVRTRMQGRVELADPGFRAEIDRTLREAVANTLAAERVLQASEPELTLFNERGYVLNGSLFDVAVRDDANPVQYVNAQRRSGALIFKRFAPATRDLHPFSLSPSTWQRVREMPWSADMQQRLDAEMEAVYSGSEWINHRYVSPEREVRSSDRARALLGLDPSRRTAIIFPHVLWDATFFYGDNLFDDYEHWLVETVRAAVQNRALNWVLKLHPSYVWRARVQAARGGTSDLDAVRRAVGELPANFHVLAPDTPISTYALLGLADYCLTVRGTVGLEIACFGATVLTAGTGRYAGLGFTVDPRSREEYLGLVRSLDRLLPITPEQVLLARKHAYALYLLRPWPYRSFATRYRPLHKLGHPLDLNVAIQVSDASELLGAEDLHRFAEWAVDSRAEDYLVPEAGGPLPEAGGPRPCAASSA